MLSQRIFFKGAGYDSRKGTGEVYGYVSDYSDKFYSDVSLKNRNGEIFRGIVQNKENHKGSRFGYIAGEEKGGVCRVGLEIFDPKKKTGGLGFYPIKSTKPNLHRANAVITGTINYDDLGNEVSRTGEIPADKDLPPVNKAASVKK